MFILDLLMIGVRTMRCAISVVLLGVVVFHVMQGGDRPFAKVLMNVVFPFGMSGALSSLVSAIIVNKLLQKT